MTLSRHDDPFNCALVYFSHARKQILLEAGHDAGALDMHKATPLHRAAASGSFKTVHPRPCCSD
jgi:hypothetical protein